MNSRIPYEDEMAQRRTEADMYARSLKVPTDPEPKRLPLPFPGSHVEGWDFRIGPYESQQFVEVWKERSEVLSSDQQWTPVQVYACELDALIAARHRLTQIAARSLAEVDRLIECCRCDSITTDNKEWNQALYDAEFFYSLGIGLMEVSDDLQPDFDRITQKYPEFFPGKNNANGIIWYDDAAALTFVTSECPHIPLDYTKAWLREWYQQLPKGEPPNPKLSFSELSSFNMIGLNSALRARFPNEEVRALLCLDANTPSIRVAIKPSWLEVANLENCSLEELVDIIDNDISSMRS